MILKQLNIEINFNKLTQLAYLDCIKANELYDYVIKYFSNHKYSEKELMKYNGILPEILFTTGEVMSRARYKCIGINSYSDIEEILNFKKGSLLYDYHGTILENIDMLNELDILEKQYNNIVDKIIELYPNNMHIKMEHLSLTKDLILDKNLSSFIDPMITIYEKIKQMIDLIIEVHFDEQVIIFLHNIETYLTVDKILNIMELVNNAPNINLIIGTSKPSYLSYENCEEINFIKYDMVEFLPDIYTLLDKINKNTLLKTEYTIQDLLYLLKLFSFDLIENKKLEQSSIYALNCLINKTKENDSYMDMESTLIL